MQEIDPKQASARLDTVTEEVVVSDYPARPVGRQG
jgi:hypothetical protein